MTSMIVIATTVIATAAMLCLAATRAWRGWLELKRLELAARSAPEEDAGEDIGRGARAAQEA